MARRRQLSRDVGDGQDALLSAEDNLGRTGAEDADQYDEHAPLNANGTPQFQDDWEANLRKSPGGNLR